MEPSQVEVVAKHSDILQVGTRNMQNYSLLTAVGKAGRPVMLKRGYGATIEEWLMAAEYIVSSGNPHVILCERGIRTFETYTRNTLDLTAVPLLHHLTHLPVIVDPSHATGKRWLVKPMALAAVAAGADGIMVEVHPNPDEARSDGEQSLTFDQFEDMASALVHDPRRGPDPDQGSVRHRRARSRSAAPASTDCHEGHAAPRGAVPRRSAGRAPARRAAAARRQVDLASGADAGRPGRGREPDRSAPATDGTSRPRPGSSPRSGRPWSGCARTA